jgi:predicted alpha/beta-hydrolase family hydrolase
MTSTKIETFLFDGPKSSPLLILAHGAGAPMDSEFMKLFAASLGRQGIRVARFEFAYMAERRISGKKRPPERAPKLLDHWRDVIAELSQGQAVAIGGKSMGGRMASMIADEVGAKHLVCLGYPFHAPGKQNKPRTEHLAELQTPTLILQGERDTMGAKDTVAGYQLSNKIKLHWAPDGNHDLTPRKKSGYSKEQNWAEAISAVSDFVLS